MLSRIKEFYLVITSYWPYGLPYQASKNMFNYNVIIISITNLYACFLLPPETIYSIQFNATSLL